MWFCTASVTVTIIFLIALEIYIWSMHGFRIDYENLQSCIELGGRWNEAINDCEGSSSYIEWKERTWY